MSPTELFPKGNLVRVELILSASESLSSTVSHRVVMHVQAGQSQVALECFRECLSSIISDRIAIHLQNGQSRVLLSSWFLRCAKARWTWTRRVRITCHYFFVFEEIFFPPVSAPHCFVGASHSQLKERQLHNLYSNFLSLGLLNSLPNNIPHLKP